MRGRGSRLPFAALCAVICFAFGTRGAQAQILLDGTLQPGNDRVPIADTSAPGDPASYEIPESVGLTAGTNLFHSFRDFQLGAEEQALFTGSAAIENVIARVTGDTPSTIAGTINSEGIPNADFYFVNPNGILFQGQDGVNRGKVEAPGAFFASTADALVFSDGRSFSSRGVGGDPTPLLTATPSQWDFLGGGSGEITIDNAIPLGVETGNRISVVGSRVRVTRNGQVQALDGLVEMGAVGSDTVRVPLDLASFALPDSALGEIVIDGGAQILAQAPSAPEGRVVLRGGRLVVDEISEIRAGGRAGEAAIDAAFSRDVRIAGASRVGVLGVGTNGTGGLRLSAEALDVSGGSQILTVSAAPGGTEAIDIDVSGTLRIRTTDSDPRQSSVLMRSQGGGSSGGLQVNAGAIVLEGDSNIESLVLGTNDGGSLALDAESIELRDGARVQSLAFGVGAAGDVRVGAETLLISGPSRISSASEPTAAASARGGDVTVTATTIELSGGGQIEAITASDAPGGSLRIVTDELRAIGAGLVNGVTAPSGLFARSGRSASEVGTGDAGLLDINARTVTLEGGALFSSRTFGDGNAGVLTLNATESVRLRGNAEGLPEISSRAAGGDGGGVSTSDPGLIIQTGVLEVLDGGAVSTSSIAEGRAGEIRIVADRVTVAGTALGEAAAILSEATTPSSADGGLITLDVTDTLTVADGGTISSRSESLVGNAGGIDILSGGAVRILDDGSVSSESFLDREAGGIRIIAGSDLELDRGDISTISEGVNSGPGGRIELMATGRIAMVDSSIRTTVQGDFGDNDAGNVSIVADEVIVTSSSILAQAVVGDGGNITITAGSYIESADSLVDASSSLGIDGTVRIEAPDTNLKDAVAQLSDDFLGGRALLRSPCAAQGSGEGSFIVAGSRGLRPAPQRPLPTRMPIPPPQPAESHATPLPSAFDVADLAGCPLAVDQEVKRFPVR